MPKIYNEFSTTLDSDSPNENFPDTLKSLWYDAKGDWHTAHELVDGKPGQTANWIHAYLHRKEGDDWNAEYWYRQAGKHFPSISLEEEHREIVEFILLEK